MDLEDNETWPEQVYQYVEHYFWEPQHLIKTAASVAAAEAKGEKKIDAFYRRIRSQEVPLNLLFDLLLRLSPGSVRKSILSDLFDIPHDFQSDPVLRLGFKEKFTHPDVLLESEHQRFYMELKIDAPVKLEQVQKYLLLHLIRDASEIMKQPFLFFLTRNNFSTHWLPTSEREDIDAQGIDQFLNKKLLKAGLPNEKLLRRAGLDSEAGYMKLVESVKFGSSTWAELGDLLNSEMKKRIQEGGELGEIIEVLFSDFLRDIEGRGLWEESA